MKAIDLDALVLAFPGPVAPPFRAVATDANGLPDLSNITAGTAALFALRGIERWSDELAGEALNRILLALQPGGVLRVATPDLDTTVFNYLFDWTENERILSRGQRFNIWWRSLEAYRVYNEEDLVAGLQEAGYVEICRFISGSGSQLAFCDLDDGERGLLVLEARRAKGPR